MINARIDTALFDLDGTLSDPAEGITRSIAFALEALGHSAPPLSDLKRFIGPALRDAFRELLNTNDPTTIERAVALYRERFAPIGLYENTVYPGIIDALQSLHAQGVTLILATAKPHVYARKILDHFAFTPYFSAVYGSELDGTRDRKEDLLAHLTADMALNPSCTVMVGDRAGDMRGARAVNMHALGVLWGYGSRDELLDAGAHSLASHAGELTQLRDAT